MVMYKVNYYQEEKEKDPTYDYAFYNCLNNENKKWDNYYTCLKEKNDLCYNVESIIIDTLDIENMKYDCFSNGILLKLYLICQKHHILKKYEQVAIFNNSVFNEEIIYNIFKTDWLINKELINNDKDELLRRKNYFEAVTQFSEDVRDIKVQFRNKLYCYFLTTFERIREGDNRTVSNDKVLKLGKFD